MDNRKPLHRLGPPNTRPTPTPRNGWWTWVVDLAFVVAIAATVPPMLGCDTGTPPPPNGNGGTENIVASVSVSVVQSSIVVGETATATAQAFNASGASLSRTFSWASSNPAVAQANNGAVLGVGVGSASIRATTDGVTGSANVEVAQPFLNADAGGVNGVYEGMVDRAVIFDGRASAGSFPIVSYVWDFGDGSGPGQGMTPTHTYPAALVFEGQTREFPVTLTITDSQGNVASATATALINHPY